VNKHFLGLFAIFMIMILAGCGSPAATPAPTETDAAATSTTVVSAPVSSTPDPCALPQLEIEVQDVHRHMREFDDAAVLASNVAREDLGDSIAELQRIRRAAEDEQIPACLTQLKAYQVQHMNSVINTLIAFMSGTDQQSLDRGIAIAREQHDQYTLELARVLGLTVVAATLPPAPSETPTP
jgi:PBP1b-binding outer membrane lipoprotein LpoB